MVITLDIPDDIFAHPKTPTQVARDVREAAVAFWTQRGDLRPGGKERLLPVPPAPERDLKALLLEMPDVGEDSDFARPPTPRSAAAEPVASDEPPSR